MQVVLKDTVFVTQKDTIIELSEKDLKKIRIDKDPHQKSANFYDRLEKKILKE